MFGGGLVCGGGISPVTPPVSASVLGYPWPWAETGGSELGLSGLSSGFAVSGSGSSSGGLLVVTDETPAVWVTPSMSPESAESSDMGQRSVPSEQPTTTAETASPTPNLGEPSWSPEAVVTVQVALVIIVMLLAAAVVGAFGRR